MEDCSECDKRVGGELLKFMNFVKDTTICTPTTRFCEISGAGNLGATYVQFDDNKCRRVYYSEELDFFKVEAKHMRNIMDGPFYPRGHSIRFFPPRNDTWTPTTYSLFYNWMKF